MVEEVKHSRNKRTRMYYKLKSMKLLFANDKWVNYKLGNMEEFTKAEFDAFKRTVLTRYKNRLKNGTYDDIVIEYEETERTLS